MPKKECVHNWKAIYYRKKLNGGDAQGWFKILNHFICDKCLKIIERETTNKEVKNG